MPLQREFQSCTLELILQIEIGRESDNYCTVTAISYNSSEWGRFSHGRPPRLASYEVATAFFLMTTFLERLGLVPVCAAAAFSARIRSNNTDAGS
jgi:hypothetical protein